MIRQDNTLLFMCFYSLVPRLLCVGGEKRAWYTLFAHAQFPQDFWEFGNFRKICSVTLTSARYADFSRIKDACHWPRSVWTMTKERQRYSALRLQKLCTRSCIPAKDCSTWLTQCLPLKFTDHFERSNADSYRRSDIVFDLKTARMGLRRSITMQCCLSAGKQNWP